VPATATAEPPVYQDVTGAPLTLAAGTGPASITVADGATPDEVVTIEYQALIRGLVALPTSDADGLTFKADPAALARAAVGDTIAIGTSLAIDCGAALPVTAIAADGLVVAGPIPPACANRTSFSVSASGVQPFVVSGSVSGFMGRTAPGTSFTFQGSYLFHPDGFNPAIPQLTFTMGVADPAVLPGNRYSFQTSSNFRPLVVSISYGTLSQACTTSLPGSVEFADVRGLARAYIAYPSANGVLELSLDGLPPGPTANARCYQ
ncbi:MAG: hypothetical protein ACYC8T_29310, partial [Myxococcaceae bacterium]